MFILHRLASLSCKQTLALFDRFAYYQRRTQQEAKTSVNSSNMDYLAQTTRITKQFVECGKLIEYLTRKMDNLVFS